MFSCYYSGRKNAQDTSPNGQREAPDTTPILLAGVIAMPQSTVQQPEWAIFSIGLPGCGKGQLGLELRRIIGWIGSR